jgi:signal recognition particle receptor subunit beta
MSQDIYAVTIHSEKNRRDISVMDIPGHPKLSSLYTQYLPMTKGIVFVIDSVDINAQVPAVAEYFKQVMVSAASRQYRIPILVACHKADELLAYPSERIRQMLEKEM